MCPGLTHCFPFGFSTIQFLAAVQMACSNYLAITLISHASKFMLKILQARLQEYMNQELPEVQAGFRKGKGTRSNCQHLLDHRESKSIPEKYLILLHWLHKSLWPSGSWQTGKLLKRWECQTTLPDAWKTRSRSNRTGHEIMDWFKIGKEVQQGCIVSHCLFNLYTDYIMQNTSLGESHVGI